MSEKLRFLGMDVHAETIAVAIAERDVEVRSLGTIPNRMESVRKLLKKLGPTEKLRACYQGLRMKNACEDLAHVLVVPSGYFSSSAQAVP